MNTTNYIRIFRGDDSDALGYQTIVGTIKTDLDLTGCKAVFRFLGFYAEFDPIPEDKKLTIVIPAQASRGFPPGVGYASLKVLDSLGKIRTFTNRIPVIVDTMTPSCGCGEFEVSFSPFPELEPLKIFVGPNADDFDQYTGFIYKIIDRASLVKYGLVMLADAMSEDGGNSGKAASPAAVKAAYDAIIATLTDNYYTSEQTEEAIDRVAAYYITYDVAGNPFPTYAALANATTVYSGGKVRIPTRNDYCVVLADETHQGAEYRYIYAIAEGQTTGSWQAQFPVEGVMTIDQTVIKNSANPVAGRGVWSAIWGALSALPTGFTSLYDWVVSQLAGKEDIFTPAMTSIQGLRSVFAQVKDGTTIYETTIPTTVMLADKQDALTAQQLANIAAVSDALAFDATHPYAAGDPVVYNGTLYTFTAAHTGAWTGNDVSAVDIIARLAAKADNNSVVHKTGNETIDGTKLFSGWRACSVVATPQHFIEFSTSGVYSTPFAILFQNGDANSQYRYALPLKSGVMALLSDLADYAPLNSPAFTGTPTAPTAASGTNTTQVATTAFVQSEKRYSLVTKTISNNAVTLDDRAANAVTISTTLSPNTLTINFPAATSGKVRDFGLRLTVASGITTAPELALPQGVTCENADGEAPEIGADGAATILYFTETAANVFLVKGEVVTAIS